MFFRFLMILVLSITPLWAVEEMCASLKDQTFFVSDRYSDVIQVGERLYLVNEFGLIVKNSNSDTPEPMATVRLGGQIQSIQYQDPWLFVSAKGEGIHRLHLRKSFGDPEILSDGNPVPVFDGYFAFEGMDSMYIAGDAMAVLANGVLSLYRYIHTIDDFVLVDEVEVDAASLVMDTRNIYFLTSSNHAHVLPFSLETGLGTVSQRLGIENNLDFYRIDYQNEALVLESLDGVIWARFDALGTLLTSGRYFTNQGKNFVLDSDVANDHLALRFTDRIEIYQVNSQRQPQLLQTMLVPFNELATTAFQLSEGSLFFLNQAQSGRGWSYRKLSLQPNQKNLDLLEVPARYDQIIGAMVVGDTLLAGTGQTIIRVAGEASTTELAYDLRRPLVEMLGNGNLIYTLTRVPGTANMEVSVLEVDDAGSVSPVFNKRYAGNLNNLTTYQGNIAFVRNFRNTQGDEYSVHVLVDEGAQNYSEEVFSTRVPINDPSPFQKLHLTEAGLLYKSGTQITLHQDVSALDNRQTFIEPGERDVIELTFSKGLFWVETAQGLSVLRENGSILEEIAKFQSWQDIRPLSEDLLIGRNVRDDDPGNHYLLRLDDSGLLTSTVTFSTSENPFLITEQGDAIVVAESTSLSRFNLVCPSRTYRYLIPYREDFELELLPVEEQEVVTFQILNARNELIGEQRMSSGILDELNGLTLDRWLLDYNTLEEPVAVNLSASTALAPIISGFASEADTSRFAFQVSESTFAELFIPHIPSDFESWQTRVFLRNDDFDVLTNLQLFGPEGLWWEQATPAGSTEAILLGPDLTPGVVPPAWGRFSSNNIQTLFSGFVLFEDQMRGQAASVPLTGDPSELLILPYMRGFGDEAWRTGITLANHNNTDVTMRIVGYSSNGAPNVDDQIVVQKQSKLVVLAENLLSDLADGEDVKWFALVGDKPLTGVALLSNAETGQLAGLPLTSNYSKAIRVNGIRNPDAWWHELVLTNIDALSGEIVITPLDEHGQILGGDYFKTLSINAKDVLEVKLDSLFADMPPSLRHRVRALDINASVDLSGYLLRGSTKTDSLEAISFYTPGF
jgi:hypothetical protein